MKTWAIYRNGVQIIVCDAEEAQAEIDRLKHALDGMHRLATDFRLEAKRLRELNEERKLAAEDAIRRFEDARLEIERFQALLAERKMIDGH